MKRSNIPKPSPITVRRSFAGLALGIAALLLFAQYAYAGLVISTASTSNVTCSNGSCNQVGNGGAVLNVTQLQTLLASSSVFVHAKNNIDVSAEVTWASANSLTLDAPASLVISKPIAVAGEGGLVLEQATFPTFGPKGRVTFWSTSSNLTIVQGQATTSYTLVNSIAMLASAIAQNPTGNYALANNYNASSDGTYASSPIPSFSGNFFGLNNTISHLSIRDSVEDHEVGLFGELSGRQSSVTWINLENVAVFGSNDSQVGAIAGVNYGDIGFGSVQGVVSTGNSSPASALGAIAGGVTGLNYYAVGNLNVGGKVKGGKNAIIGGAVGENGLKEGQSVGGGVGVVYSTTTVSLDSGSCGNCAVGEFENSAGGLVGVNDGFVINSYAAGSVSSKTIANLGGLVGLDVSGSPNETIESYSTGTVTGISGSSVGGAIGFDQGSDDISDVYWDTSTSGVANSGQGAGNISNDTGITGLTTTQLQSGLPMGFNSTDWGENASINGGLPYLLAAPPKK